jgi:hypothetical protein
MSPSHSAPAVDHRNSIDPKHCSCDGRSHRVRAPTETDDALTSANVQHDIATMMREGICHRESAVVDDGTGREEI